MTSPLIRAVTEPRVEQELFSRVRAHLGEQLRGMPELIDFALAAFLAGGHLLLEGPPGTGKTSLAKALAGALGGTFRRVQMTSDLLPSDIVGLLRLKPGATEFEFRPGPVFTHFLLADELNRTSPKTQSALLEAMAEGTVTVDGRSHPLPRPFFVIATRNPGEFHGVYPLPESSLDRFMLQLLLAPPARPDELGIYQASLKVGAARAVGAAGIAATSDLRSDPILMIDQARGLIDAVARTHVEETVLEYIADLVRATRVLKEVSHGVSVRAGLQLISASRALAFVRGRDYVLPKDVADLAVSALAHRLRFATGDPELPEKHRLIHELLERVRPPR